MLAMDIGFPYVAHPPDSERWPPIDYSYGTVMALALPPRCSMLDNAEFAIVLAAKARRGGDGIRDGLDRAHHAH